MQNALHSVPNRRDLALQTSLALKSPKSAKSTVWLSKVFAEAALRQMREIEEKITSDPRWPEFCLRAGSTVGKIRVRSYSCVFFTFFTFLHVLVSRPDPVRFM